ncbi:hypothetical protein Tco_1048225 [Tanacetum coccineum]
MSSAQVLRSQPFISCPVPWKNGNALDCQGVMWWDKVGRQGGEERGTISWCILAGSEDRTTKGDVQLFAPYLKVLGNVRMVPEGV